MSNFKSRHKNNQHLLNSHSLEIAPFQEDNDLYDNLLQSLEPAYLCYIKGLVQKHKTQKNTPIHSIYQPPKQDQSARTVISIPHQVQLTSSKHTKNNLIHNISGYLTALESEPVQNSQFKYGREKSSPTCRNYELKTKIFDLGLRKTKLENAVYKAVQKFNVKEAELLERREEIIKEVDGLKIQLEAEADKKRLFFQFIHRMEEEWIALNKDTPPLAKQTKLKKTKYLSQTIDFRPMHNPQLSRQLFGESMMIDNEIEPALERFERKKRRVGLAERSTQKK